MYAIIEKWEKQSEMLNNIRKLFRIVILLVERLAIKRKLGKYT